MVLGHRPQKMEQERHNTKEEEEKRNDRSMEPDLLLKEAKGKEPIRFETQKQGKQWRMVERVGKSGVKDSKGNEIGSQDKGMKPMQVSNKFKAIGEMQENENVK